MEAKKRRTRWTPSPVTQFGGWIAPGDNPRDLDGITSTGRTYSFTVWHSVPHGWQWEVSGPAGLSTGPRPATSQEEAFSKVEELVGRKTSNLGNGCW